MKKSFLFFLVCSICFSCEEKEEMNKTPDLSLQCEYLEPLYFGICFGGLFPPSAKEIVIKNNNQYQNLGDSCRLLKLSSVNCDTANLPDIDFIKYSLIGKHTEGGGCTAEYSRNLVIDTVKKEYNYTIEVVYKGECDMLHMNMNWMLVPAIPDNYSVIFH